MQFSSIELFTVEFCILDWFIVALRRLLLVMLMLLYNVEFIIVDALFGELTIILSTEYTRSVFVLIVSFMQAIDTVFVPIESPLIVPEWLVPLVVAKLFVMLA